MGMRMALVEFNINPSQYNEVESLDLFESIANNYRTYPQDELII